MKILGLLLLLASVTTIGLAVLNWHIFIAPAELSLGFTIIQLPLGLVMLGLLVFITALFLMNMVYLQSSTLLERLHHSRELEANRKLIDQTETSQFTELHSFIESELLKQTVLTENLKSEVFARFGQIEDNLHSSILQSENSLAAYIGELEDRLGKAKNFSD